MNIGYIIFEIYIAASNFSHHYYSWVDFNVDRYRLDQICDMYQCIYSMEK